MRRFGLALLLLLSGGSGRSSDWRKGYEDGQRLAFDLELMRRLRDCFVPVPSLTP